MKKYLSSIKDHKEILLVALILCVLAMVVIPIPHQLMDVLIGINIGLTIVILMVVIYMKSPLELSSFPSILLVLALFRIGITISSSRLILLYGDAGQIITAFGEFVVGGNLVVGIIIFSIITIINFIVITKGSERVAEVAARFSLDAMPGKQMSIDSDLKAENITMEEAKVLRNNLGLESKLYGAMDGAMKFVKGDAIASIIDIIINLGGGIIIGMVQNSMNFGDALKTYTLLTVGDGLVQQVPALLISLTAGMMITRVSDDNSKIKENMGANIINQVFGNPKALYSASMMFLFMSAVPGMPSILFLVLFIGLVGFATYVLKRGNIIPSTTDKKKDDIVEDKNTDSSKVDDDFVSWKLQPLVINLAANLKQTEYTEVIKKALIEVRKNILVNLGVEIPQIVIRFVNNLQNNCYQIWVFEIPVSEGRFYPKHILLLKSDEESLAALDAANPHENEIRIGADNEYKYWVPEKNAAKCDEFGIIYFSIEQFLVIHLSMALRKNIADFFGMQEVKNLLNKMDELQDLIKELLRMLPLNKITEILQRLLAEDISIRNFKVILDAMLEWSQREKEVVVIVEYVRQALGRYIAYKYSDGTYIISCFLLDENIEDIVRDAIRFNERGSYLAIDPNISNNIIEAVRASCAEHENLLVPPVIISQMDTRRYVRSIIEKELPHIHVLSYQEIEAHVQFNSLGVIEI